MRLIFLLCLSVALAACDKGEPLQREHSAATPPTNTTSPGVPPSDVGEQAVEGAGVVSPKMGLGLNGIAYWGSSFPFLNLMKQGTAGELHPNAFAPEGTAPLYYEQLEAMDIVDKDGWPRHIPEHYYWLSYIATDANDGFTPSQRGRYLLRYKGEGRVRVITNGVVVSQQAGEILFDITSDHCVIQVLIEESDPNNRGDYVRDIAIVPQQYWELYEAGQLFNPKWLALIKDMRVLRFMDWQFTNGSLETSWGDRPTLSSNSWGVTLRRSRQKGVPLEALVALANQTGTDPWFNFPIDASDDYVDQFARYVAEHLDPDLQAYFELSNEVWNWMFPQTHTAQARGLALFGDRFGQSVVRQYYGYRSAQISHRVHRAFGENAAQRVHFTLATQTDDTTYPLSTAIDGAQVYLDAQGLTLDTLFDSIAVTWYLLIPPELMPQIAQWIASEGEAVAMNRVFDQMSGRRLAFVMDDGNEQPCIEKLLNDIRIQAELAQQYGLKTISYEGGTHLLGYNEYNELLADFFIAVNNDARMGDLYYQVYRGWQTIPGATFLNHFVEISGHSKFGSWGALRHLDDHSARWDFITEVNQEAPDPTWETRTHSAFVQGVTRFGDINDNTLNGIEKQDFLMGREGNDDLHGGAGADGLHGGAGDDSLYGDAGDDVLVGGEGEDQLNGGAGRDRFVAGDIRQVDTINDFSALDVLDFRSILPNVTEPLSVTDYISYRATQAGLLILVDVDGNADAHQAQAVFRLAGVTQMDIDALIDRGGILLR